MLLYSSERFLDREILEILENLEDLTVPRCRKKKVEKEGKGER